MPPKKKQDQANKKTQDKQKQKVIEVCTIGLDIGVLYLSSQTSLVCWTNYPIL